MRAGSVIEPTAFDASVNATTRVRSPISPSSASWSSVTSPARIGAWRTTRSWSCADQQPGRHVGVVVELGHDDLVARLERARDRVREQEVERGHVRSERDPVGSPPVKSAAAARPRSITGRPPPRWRTRRPGWRSPRAGRRRPRRAPAAAPATRRDRRRRPRRRQRRESATAHAADVKRSARCSLR